MMVGIVRLKRLVEWRLLMLMLAIVCYGWDAHIAILARLYKWLLCRRNCPSVVEVLPRIVAPRVVWVIIEIVVPRILIVRHGWCRKLVSWLAGRKRKCQYAGSQLVLDIASNHQKCSRTTELEF